MFLLQMCSVLGGLVIFILFIQIIKQIFFLIGFYAKKAFYVEFTL